MMGSLRLHGARGEKKSEAYFICTPDKKDIFSRMQHLSFPGFFRELAVSSQFDRRVGNSIV